MRRLVKLYGASPLHLLAVLAAFALAGYAATFLLVSRPVAVAIWFAGAAVAHDLILLPLYGLADTSVTEVFRRAPSPRGVPWLNHLRFPVAISLLLLLVFWPAITRRATALQGDSTLTNQPYLAHWLLVTGVLFALSAISYAYRLRLAARRAHRRPEIGVIPSDADDSGLT